MSNNHQVLCNYNCGISAKSLQLNRIIMQALFTSAIHFTLKMKETGSSKMMVCYRNNTQCHNPENSNVNIS